MAKDQPSSFAQFRNYFEQAEATQVTQEESDPKIKSWNNLSDFTLWVLDDKISQAASLATATLKSSFKSFRSRQTRSHQVTTIQDRSAMSLIFLFSTESAPLSNLKAVKCLSTENTGAKKPAHAAKLLETNDISGCGRSYHRTIRAYSQMQPTDSVHCDYDTQYHNNNSDKTSICNN